MAVPKEQQFAGRVNILLPDPMPAEEAVEGLPQPSLNGFWGRSDYQNSRRILGMMEQRESAPEEIDPALVNALVRAIADNQGMAGIMSMQEDGQAPAARYITTHDLDGTGPPENVPLLIPEIGVLSAPAPMDDLAPAEAAIQQLEISARVEPAVMYRAIGAILGEAGQDMEIASDSMDTFAGEEEEEESREWLEALLQEGLALETIPYGVKKVRAPQCWARGYRGQGVRVAVVDTGIGPHIDLPRPIAGATFVSGSTSWFDDNGHGTHVAGTIAAMRNRRGVVGVAPRADLLAAKVLSRTGGGADTWVAAGIVWAVNQGAHIINLSLGGGFSVVIQRAIAYARRNKVAVIAAAGNTGGPPVDYPGRDPMCIAVAATDHLNRRAGFSSQGPELDLAAPGRDILSTYPGNTYRMLNGTSMATPHVAGVAALLLSRARLDPTALQRRLEGNALHLGARRDFGSGLVQADRAVLFPRPGTTAASEEIAMDEAVAMPMEAAGHKQRSRATV